MISGIVNIKQIRLCWLYGIVVVAIITSVVVNFYGEVRRMTDHKSDTEKELPDEDE